MIESFDSEGVFHWMDVRDVCTPQGHMAYRLELVTDLHDHVGLSVTICDTTTGVESAIFRTSKTDVKRFSNVRLGSNANVAESRGRTSKELAALTQ